MTIPPLQPFIPDSATLLVVGLLGLAYALGAAAAVAWLHAQRGVRTAYTRKIFHFLIIGAAALIQLRYGAPGVVTYGVVVSALILAAVGRGAGFAFYEALARPSDAPRRTLFILVPLATTALGGLIATLLVPEWAHVGYAAVACGDAIGEPVGARWGRHRFRVPSLGGVAAQRSLEGSMAVLLATVAAVAGVLALTGIDAAAALRAALGVGIVTALVEAFSHHGLDNLTIQVAASLAAAALLG